MPQLQGLPRLSHIKGSRFTAPPDNTRDMIKGQGALPGIEDGEPDNADAPEEGSAPKSPSTQSLALGGEVSGDGSGDDSDQTGALNLGEDGTGDRGDGIDTALNTVSDVLDFGRKKYGLGQQDGQDQQVAGNIPAVPAGPGGDQEQGNPFGTRTPAVPFGKRTSQSFDDGGDVRDDQQGAYNPEGDDPVGAVLSQGAQGLAQAAQPYQTEQTPLAEEGQVAQGGAMAALPGQAASAVEGAMHGPGNTAVDPDTTQEGGFGGAAQAVGQAAQPYMQKIISYLKGGDAAPPQAANMFEGKVDPQGQMDPGMRKLLAIDTAAKQYGPEAAWSLVQHYRQKYDAYKSFAAAANSGVQGKPRDPAAAAMALQQAYDHVPDGLNLTVKPSPTGFTATVTPHGGGRPQTVSLTPQDFGKLAQGPEGQFDSVIENGLPNVLTKFVQRNGLTADQTAPDTSTTAPAGSEPTVNNGNVDGPDKPFKYDALGYDPEIARRAQALFPKVSQTQQRIEWMAAQEQQGKTNEIGMRKIDNQVSLAKIRGGFVLDKARIGADSREKVAGTREEGYNRRTDAQAATAKDRTGAYRERTVSAADNARLQQARISQDARQRDAAQLLQRVISAGPLYSADNMANPAVKQALDTLGMSSQQAQAPQGQAPAPAAQPQKPLSAQDTQALNWAKANPTDPRAGQIKKRLGVQ
jgi:hypothetical protein